MNLKEIKEMINLMEEHHLTELEVEKEDFKIRLKKGASGVIERDVSELPQSHTKDLSAAKQAQEVSGPPAEKKVITSPMVGTFYATPQPDAKPYVELGQVVEVGQVVCIIEAMKLMNEIKSEIRGKVVEIKVTNGNAVEFGQPLFVLE